LIGIICTFTQIKRIQQIRIFQFISSFLNKIGASFFLSLPEHAEKYPSIFNFTISFAPHWNQRILWTSAYILVVLMLLYVGLSVRYYTFIDQYVWIVSSAYLSGIFAAVIMLVGFLCLFAGLILVNYRYQQNQFVHKLEQGRRSHSMKRQTSFWLKIRKSHTTNPQAPNDQSYWRLVGIGVVLMVANFRVTLLVNEVYVMSINRGYSAQISFCISSVSLSLFKIGYNYPMIQGKARQILENTLGIEMGDKLVLLFSLVNNVVVPYCAEMFVSPDCFYYAINEAPAVQTTFYDVNCVDEIVCDQGSCRH
jgi:hypothetical protein